MSVAEQVTVGIGLGLGVLLSILALVYLLRLRRLKRRQHLKENKAYHKEVSTPWTAQTMVSPSGYNPEVQVEQHKHDQELSGHITTKELAGDPPKQELP